MHAILFLLVHQWFKNESEGFGDICWIVALPYAWRYKCTSRSTRSDDALRDTFIYYH